MRAYCKCITKKQTSLLWMLENSRNPVHLFPGRCRPGKRICTNRFFIQSRSDVCEARHMTCVLWKEGRQIWSKLFSVQHLQASSNTSSSSGLNMFVPRECCTDKWRWKNSDVFIGPGFEARTSALYFIGDPSTRPSKKPWFPLKHLLRILVIKYLGFIGFLSCRRLPWGKFSKGMEELTADCDRLRGNKVQNEFKPGGLWGSDLVFPLTHRSV